MAPLTFDLIARPVHGWQRLAQSERAARTPLLHAAAVAACSVLAAFVGGVLSEAASVGRATVILLAVTAGYVGAAVVATRVVPRLVRLPNDDPARLATYAGLAALPVIATGGAFLAPWEPLWWFAIVLGCAATARSAAVGARRYLGRQDGTHHRTAAIVAVLASAPVLAVATFRSIA